MRNVLDKVELRKADKAACKKRRRTDEAHCIHYWIIESPDGPTSRGVCKHCGAEKEFRNYVVYSPWEDEIAKSIERPRATADEI
ncbi:MAG TPA: hypothetical protein G4O13_00180 [Dehalococcoidia bacterium]|nr:hypothetical protein [Dehalococcoidia bacterium]